MLAEIIQPNWHVAILHFPLALLAVGVLAEIFGRPLGPSRIAGRWMILAGALLGIPTALSGLFALRDVVVMDQQIILRPWYEVVAASGWTAAQWTFISRHAWLSAIGAGLTLLVVLVWLLAGEPKRRRLRLPGIVVLVLGVGSMLVGAWHSGEAVYRLGTAVEPLAGWPELTWDIPFLQAHVVGAGIALAATLLALARILHWSTSASAIAVAPGIAPRATLRPPWVLALALLLCNAVIGYWLVAGSFEPARVSVWWQKLTEHGRLLAHLLGGGSLIVLTLLGLVFPRMIARRAGLRILFTCGLLLASAAQIWFGALLLFDSPRGPITGFMVAPPTRANIVEASSERGRSMPAASPAPDGGAPATGDAGDASTSAALVIEMTEAWIYEPAEATVAAGSLVIWRNVSEVVHTVTARDDLALDPAHAQVPAGAEPFHSGEIEPGTSWSWRFKVPGRYLYFCVPHEKAGMLGTLTVTERK